MSIIYRDCWKLHCSTAFSDCSSVNPNSYFQDKLGQPVPLGFVPPLCLDKNLWNKWQCFLQVTQPTALKHYQI